MRLRLLPCALLLACAPAPTEPPGRVRLWADVPATLVEQAPTTEPVRVFASRFESGLDGWEPIITPWRQPGGLTVERSEEDGRACVDLGGAHGGLHAVVPVEPSTCYVFRGSLRLLDLVPAGDTFDGARFWLAQASAEATFVEFRTTRIELMTDAYSTPSIYPSAGWREQRRVFVTRPDTHFLHIVCALATEDDARSGGVRFADVSLEKHPLVDAWREPLERAVAMRAVSDPAPRGEPTGRRVAAELGGETRPSFVLLPGERLRFELPELAPGARLALALALGPWEPAPPLRDGMAFLRIRANTEELPAPVVALAQVRGKARWSPFEAPLPPGTRTLELAVDGDAPLAIGSPLVRSPGSAIRRPSVLLVSIDTLRADHVGSYGRDGDPTPNLDRLATRGLRCADASTQAPYTLPSHTSLLTGQFPSVHGVVAHDSTLSASRSTSLAELLARAGYTTRAFTSGGFVNSFFGLDQGFEAFSDIDPIREEDSHYFRTLVRRYGKEDAAALLEDQGFAAVERWLKERGPEPFFLFLHTYAVHDYDSPRRCQPCDALGCSRPRVPPRTDTPEEAEAYTPEMRAHIEHLYEGALRYTDERLGRLLDALAGSGRLDDTLVVVTSDHGEEFFEHGALQHGRTLYEELLAVPLLIAGPGVPQRTLETPAMLIDVAPTVLARLDLPPPPHAQGIDLLAPAPASRTVWSEVDTRFAHKYARRTPDGAKTIHGPDTPALRFPNARAWEHFDLRTDPREQHDLGPVRAAEADLEALRATLESLGSSLGEAEHVLVDPATRQELDGLGYGGGGGN